MEKLIVMDFFNLRSEFVFFKLTELLFCEFFYKSFGHVNIDRTFENNVEQTSNFIYSENHFILLYEGVLEDVVNEVSSYFLVLSQGREAIHFFKEPLELP